MTTDRLDDYRWLISEAGIACYDSLLDDSRSLLQRTRRLRKQVSASRAHLVLELVELRQRGAVKFDEAKRLFFTPRALEQASDQWIADYKAQRFPVNALVADLCCGIGGDLFSLARHAPTVGVDLDPVHALLAEANCQALGLQTCRAEVTDAATFDLRPCAAWHIDPDRRPSGQRTTHVDYAVPPASRIDQLLRQLPHAALKTAPAADLPPSWKANAERQWIGSRRECKQQVVWFGELARHPGQHTAAVVNHRKRCSDLLVGQPFVPIEPAPSLGRYLFEPHAAVLAAQLTGALAAKHSLRALDPTTCYLTSDGPIDDPLIDCFTILDSIPFDLRKSRALLRRHDIGPLEVKKRGVKIEPNVVRRKVQGKGSRQATLVIAPGNGSVRAILCQRHIAP